MTKDADTSAQDLDWTDDAAAWNATMADITAQSQRLLAAFLAREGLDKPAEDPDPFNVAGAFMALTTRMLSQPAQLAEAQMSLWKDYTRLWQSTTMRFLGEDAEPAAEPERGDRRFKDDAWREHAVFDTIKQAYLITARWMRNTVNEVNGLSADEKLKVDFYTRQYVNAVSPSNFVMTNPEVLQETIRSKGQNLVRGLENVLEDLEAGKGNLRIKMTDTDKFEVGKNVAATPGKVVYQNDLGQLIQYEPRTETQFKTPLMIIPPWINKFYILDLRPENSFIRWALEQGHSVFVVSWVNPDGRHRGMGFDDYLRLGMLDMLEQTRRISGAPSANVIGYCLGGTLLGCGLSYLHSHGRADEVASATFFVAMTDFSEPGEMKVFIDDEQIETLERRMEEKGYLEGEAMATAFNMLRDNDLIWSFVVNNYLMGKDPFPFDLLYWNQDATRMPAKMHAFYLRHMYLHNALREPGAVSLLDTPIDLSQVKTPAFEIAAKEDHIAPWRTCYKSLNLLGGARRFCLAASGHIAGVVNHPDAQKYGHWTNEDMPADPMDWLAGATEHPGSWWPHWQTWIAPFCGESIPARVPGKDAKGKAFKVIEDAPGSYVRVKA